MKTMHQILPIGFAMHFIVLCYYPTVRGDAENTVVIAGDASNRVESTRQKRAPGWGKRVVDIDTYENEKSEERLDSSEDFDVDKRAPGWGKRDMEMEKQGYPEITQYYGLSDKRAPGWGKRAPGWGKRAPGWGKRAPGWGKRAPGWGKRAPGWGKRENFDSEQIAMDKRAPGWGKRAPGWGKRSVLEETSPCDSLKDDLEFFVIRAVEVRAFK